MSDDWSKTMAQMMAQGAEMAKGMQMPEGMPSFADWVPTMPAEMLELWMGKTMNPDGLDARTRLLVTLAGLTVLGGQAEDHLRLTVRHALQAGATPQEVAEVIAQMAPLGGVPAMQAAMATAKDEIQQQEEGDKA